MDNNDFYNLVMAHNTIYSLMYSPSRVEWQSLEEQIVEIATNKLEWARDKSCFFYVWGWLGPDCNEYSLKTYGLGWAFNKNQIIEAWRREDARNNLG